MLWESSASSGSCRERTGNWLGKILQRSGQLAASTGRSYDDESASLGTNKIYAAIQNLGGKAGRGHKTEIPARPFLNPRHDMAKIERAAGEFLLEGP